MSDNQELLVVLDELGNIFAEKREGRIGYNDVRLFEKFDTLG